MSALDKALLAAHAAQDQQALIRLYAQAAEETADPDAAAFFLTHAYVFALEAGHPDADTLRQQLIKAGREEPLPPPPKARR